MTERTNIRLPLVAISFDVFDTLIARDRATEQDVVVEVCRSIRTYERALLLADLRLVSQRLLYWGRTTSAKGHLRDRSEYGDRYEENGEPSLDRIWTLAAALEGAARSEERTLAATEGINWELAVEAKHLRPRPLVNWLLRRLQSAGIGVTLFSDMYLRDEQLEQILDSVMRSRLAVPVMTSASTGKDKASGSWFRSDAGSARIRIHVGDRLRTEAIPALKNGVFPIPVLPPYQYWRRKKMMGIQRHQSLRKRES